MDAAADTIAAIATATGRGAIGIVRVSGPGSAAVAMALAGQLPPVRRAVLVTFPDPDGAPIDTGLMLRFEAPASYTGEDMLELHCHGGTVTPGRLLRRVLGLGARPARPGEFTERAFLNGRMDLLQAEAVADLIDSQTERAARCAARALAGDFSRAVDGLQRGLTALRVRAEAGLDFPDEELGTAERGDVARELARWHVELDSFRQRANTGHGLRHGLRVVIAGPPNAGKSSLLNRLLGMERAIVDDSPGTTRDVVEADLELAGLRLSIADTAGIRAGADPVERAGVERTLAALEHADVVLVVTEHDRPDDAGLVPAAGRAHRILVRNKIDRLGTGPALRQGDTGPEVLLSARTGAGMDLLREAIAGVVPGTGAEEDVLLARTRHLHALDECARAAERARVALATGAGMELVAEELRLGQVALGRITGAVSADDLLGEIFAQFCIGK